MKTLVANNLDVEISKCKANDAHMGIKPFISSSLD